MRYVAMIDDTYFVIIILWLSCLANVYQLVGSHKGSPLKICPACVAASAGYAIISTKTTPLIDETATLNGIQITTTSSNHISGISKGQLPFNLPMNTRKCHQVPKIHTSLFSIGQACDTNCTAVLKTPRRFYCKNKRRTNQIHR